MPYAEPREFPDIDPEIFNRRRGRPRHGQQAEVQNRVITSKNYVLLFSESFKTFRKKKR